VEYCFKETNVALDINQRFSSSRILHLLIILLKNSITDRVDGRGSAIYYT
jgi:hypothetical protein